MFHKIYLPPCMIFTNKIIIIFLKIKHFHFHINKIKTTTFSVTVS